MAENKPSGETRKTMGGNEMSAEELPTPRTDAEAYEVPRDNELRLIDGLTEVVAAGFARQLERELVQAKAELSALSRASGEAVAWEPDVVGEWKFLQTQMPFSHAPKLERMEISFAALEGIMRRAVLAARLKIDFAAPTAPGMCLVPGCHRAHPHENMGAICSVQWERLRQVKEEGYDDAHDDAHESGGMADAAACYAATGPIFGQGWLDRSPMEDRGDTPAPRLIQHSVWPWDAKWWKPKDRRSNLVRAGALILAEIERLDRVAAKGRAA